MNHRGRSAYSFECLGLLYLIIYIALAITNIKILAPVFNGDVVKVGTDYSPVDMEDFEMTISEFNKNINLSLTIES